MKKCSKCKEEKEYLHYFKCGKSKDGLQSQCKSCKVVSVRNAPSSKNKKNKALSGESLRKRREYKRQYHHKTKIARNVSRRIRQSLNGVKKTSNWEALVGYTLHELKIHLENKFKLGMNWDNYGSVWHIDHIRPISSFNITSDSSEEFKSCWALQNLQPLFAFENLRKGDKY
jgi:hypothetical protein